MSLDQFPEYYLRNEYIDGITSWLWIQTDTGAWDGPKNDWETSHKDKYLKYCKNKRTVVCAGGNQGMYPRLLSDHFENVIAFEPDPFNFHALVNNCKKTNIIKLNAALGISSDFVKMNRPNMTNTGTHTVDFGGNIPLLPLDGFQIQDLDLLQLDMEGYEYNALQGAAETLKRCRPVISCENGHSTISTYLSELCGYRIVDQSVSDTIFAV